MNPILTELNGMAVSISGMDISVYDETFLLKSLEKRKAALGLTGDAQYLAYCARQPVEVEAYIRSLTVPYSEFFRNSLAFEFLAQWVFPRMLEEKAKNGPGEIRIWSAGCAAGQEAYSLAIVLEELIALREKPAPYRIIATDTSESELAAAREGVYDPAALRNARLRQIEPFFVRRGDAWCVSPVLKDKVDFSRYDLLDARSFCPPASIFGGFDLVVCCNVMYYYRIDIRKRMLNKLHHCLSPQGFLLTGEVESDFVEEQGDFCPVSSPVTIYKKLTRPQA